MDEDEMDREFESMRNDVQMYWGNGLLYYPREDTSQVPNVMPDVARTKYRVSRDDLATLSEMGIAWEEE